ALPLWRRNRRPASWPQAHQQHRAKLTPGGAAVQHPCSVARVDPFDNIHLMFTLQASYTTWLTGLLGTVPVGDSDGIGMARILLAEDDDDMRRFLVKALERAGYDVSDFDNGA